MKLLGLPMAGVLALSAPVLAQAWPSRPVTFIVTSAPGGPHGVVAKLIGDQLEKKWGQPVIVDYKAGAAGLLGSDFVKRAAPDGYTVLFGADSLTTIRIFVKNTDFDMEKDLAPITIAAYTPFIVHTTSKVPAKNMKEFIAYAKTQPGKLNYGVIGQSQQMLDSMILTRTAGLDMVAVPYLGAAPLLTALLGGDLQLYVGSYSASAQHIKAGSLVPLAAAGDQRNEALPDVPTLKEQGIDQLAGFWYGFFANKDTPRPIADKLTADIREAMQKPEIVDELRSKFGLYVIASTQQEMAQRVAREIKMRTEAANAANIQPQ